MSIFYPNIILKRLEEELESLKNQSIEKKILAEKSVGLCQLAFLELKKNVFLNNFENINEEILFFKTVKPKVFSKLIFYNELLRIETYKPLVHRKLMIRLNPLSCHDSMTINISS